MSDVFISFSTRGGTDTEWIQAFRENLEEAWASNYGNQDLKVWEMSKNEGNFQQGIDEAIRKTLTLILVLDPAYLNSPQTLDEIKKYQQERKNKGYEEFIIKVIKRRGDQEEELRKLVDSNLLTYHFSRVKSRSNTEEEYGERSREYREEVEKIVGEIRKHEIRHRRKVNADKLLARLAEMSKVPKVYVALGDSNLTDNRVKFINELNETIKRHPNEKLRKVKVLPDDFTFTLFDHEALSELLCEENDYRPKCLDALLSECAVVIVPFETDNKSEAELYLNKIRFQLQAIKMRAQDFELPVHLFLNIPDILYQTSEFKHEFINPALAAYKNIKRVQHQDIPEFIKAFMEDLTEIVSPAQKLSQQALDRKKQIYLLEYDSAVNGEIPTRDLDQEAINRSMLRQYIESFNFKVLPELKTTGDATNEGQPHGQAQTRQDYLKQSDGIIIYRGIREDDTWCQMQQVKTHKELKALKDTSLAKDLKRAVFIDPAQQDKDSYDIYDFQVITKHPPELKDFLWQIQQH